MHAINTQAQNRPTLLRLFSRESQSPAPVELLSTAAFERQLVIERARTERSRFIFTMIAFTIEEAENEVDCARAQRALTVALMQRTRACDTKGWLGERIAVILPYTTVAGARGLVQKIDALFYENYQESGSAAGNASLSCAMYEYPADRIDAMTAKPQE